MNSQIKSTMGLREWGLLLLLSFLWGCSFLFIKVAVVALPSLTLVTLRVAIASVVLWAYIFMRGVQVPRLYKIWLAFACMGFLNNVIPFSLIVWGQKEITAGLASILNATTPLFAIFVAGVILPDERATPMKLIGAIIGFFGVVVMIGTEVLKGVVGVSLLPQFAILAAAFSYACAGVYGRRFKAMQVHPIVIAAGQVSASTVLILPVALFVETPLSLPMPALEIWLSVIALSVVSTAFAYILYFRLLASSGATNLMLVTFLLPLTAIGLGIAVLGEELKAVHLIGLLLIGSGLSIIDGRIWKYAGRSIFISGTK